ncbi:MAG: hypothetical protein QG579_117 [Patescibacteria group bacterium]|jgi:hypothetical protein|nr:hypothetical protein [Patescibacteria group bacterium]
MRYGYKYKKPRSMSKEDEFAWVVTGVVFIFFLIVYSIYGFVANCIIEWPIRWDMGTCWHEQIGPAKEKASEKAIIFVP